MRCANLTGTWNELRHWLDEAGVLMLPPLERAPAAVRLDADIPASRPASPAELARALGRLHALVTRFDVRAVYIGRTSDGPVPTSVTIRALADGVVHELSLVATTRQLATDLDTAYAP